MNFEMKFNSPFNVKFVSLYVSKFVLYVQSRVLPLLKLITTLIVART